MAFAEATALMWPNPVESPAVGHSTAVIAAPVVVVAVAGTRPSPVRHSLEQRPNHSVASSAAAGTGSSRCTLRKSESENNSVVAVGRAPAEHATQKNIRVNEKRTATARKNAPSGKQHTPSVRSVRVKKIGKKIKFFENSVDVFYPG